MSLASLNQRFILFVFVVSSFFFSSYTITEGPLFKNKEIGKSAIVHIDEKYVYTYRKNPSGVYFYLFDRTNLSLIGTKEVTMKEMIKRYGKHCVIYPYFYKNEVQLKVKSVQDDCWYVSDFEMDKILLNAEEPSFNKMKQEEEYTKSYEKPDDKEGIEWTLLKTDDNESEFFGTKFGKESEFLYVKTVTSTGKVLKRHEILLDKSFSEKYWKVIQENKENISLSIIEKVIVDDNSMYICAVLGRNSSYTIHSSYTTEQVTYWDYDEVWVFRFDKKEGFIWSKVFPLGQHVSFSSNSINGSNFYASYGLFGVLESDKSLTFLFNYKKDNIAKFDSFSASSKLDLFWINTSDNAALMAVTMDKKSGKWSHETVHDNNKKRAYINTYGGYAFNGAYYMLVDMPKKNKTGLYKFSL